MRIKHFAKGLFRLVRGPGSVRLARHWSNREIAKLAPFASGEIVNVSAWRDEDKEGRTYRDYFSGASNYYTTNFDGWRGTGERADFSLDLQQPPPGDLVERFHLVFNHTTLEHVFDIHQALRTMASISKDSILVVVPFIQHLHGPKDGDFWRPSPYAIRRLFEANGFVVCYESAGPEKGDTRYLVYWASRFPQNWTSILPKPDSNAEAVLRAKL